MAQTLVEVYVTYKGWATDNTNSQIPVILYNSGGGRLVWGGIWIFLSGKTIN